MHTCTYKHTASISIASRQALPRWSVQRIEIAYHVAPKLRRITHHSIRSSPPLTTSRHTQNQPQEKTKRNGKIVVANSHGSLSNPEREPVTESSIAFWRPPLPRKRDKKDRLDLTSRLRANNCHNTSSCVSACATLGPFSLSFFLSSLDPRSCMPARFPPLSSMPRITNKIRKQVKQKKRLAGKKNPEPQQILTLCCLRVLVCS